LFFTLLFVLNFLHLLTELLSCLYRNPMSTKAFRSAQRSLKWWRNKQDNSWSANILPVYPRWKRDHNPESKDDCFATCKCALPLLRLYLFIILFLVLFWYNFFPSFNVYLLQLLYDFFQGTHEVRSLCAGQSMLQSYIKHFFLLQIVSRNLCIKVIM